MRHNSSLRQSPVISPRLLFLAVTLVSLAAPLAAQTQSDKNTSVKTANNENVSDKIVNVYSYRQPFLVEPLFEKFTNNGGSLDSG